MTSVRALRLIPSTVIGLLLVLPGSAPRAADIVVSTGAIPAPLSSSYEGGGCEPVAFPHTVLAPDKLTLSWGANENVLWAKGQLSQVADYGTTAVGLLIDVSSHDTSTDAPGPGSGLYYLFRLEECGSWQTTVGAEPDRDTALPDSARGGVCGDGFTDPGETCDDAGESAFCDDDCTAVECGDGNLNQAAGEECDDGNTTLGDGCDATCTEEGPACQLHVTNTDDSGAGSLRQAIADATSGDTVCIDVTGTITLGSILTVDKDLTILGSGADLLTVDANGQSLGFQVLNTYDVAISDVTVTGASSIGISVGKYGILTLTSSTITGNSIGVRTVAATANLDSCTVSFNGDGVIGQSSPPVQGSEPSTLAIVSSTISGNDSYGVHGTTALIQSTTFTDNYYYGLHGSTVTIGNSILRDSGSYPNCAGTVAKWVSLGGNISSDSSCSAALTQPTDQNNTDPMLLPLANNGGPTATHALAPGSPAIDQGECPGEVVDQRGFPRPVDDPAVADGAAGFCDSGAYERQP